MVDIDYSFIRLRKSQEEAFNQGESPAVTLQYEGQVHLKPFDLQPYLQKTNVPGGIAIEDYTLFIVDCYGNEFNATDSLHIQPFVDSDNIQQLAFELVYIQKDFGGELVYFRIDQLNKAESWYSNRMLITNQEIEYTSRIDYRHNERYQGKDYPILNLFEGIRLNFYYNDHVDQTEDTDYYAISTNQTFSLRSNTKFLNEYVAEQFNGWSAKRMNLALKADQSYIDEVRQESIGGFEPEKRESDSNLKMITFLTDPIETDIRTPSFQIYDGFMPITFNPAKGSNLNVATAAALSQVQITFNQDISLEAGFLGSIIRPTNPSVTINNLNVSVAGPVLTIDTTGIFNEVGAFSIVINANGVKGARYGELWSGVNDYFINVSLADFDSNDFLANDFLT